MIRISVKWCSRKLEEAKSDMDTCTQELKVLLLPKDPNDDKNVIIEIRGGAGGEESFTLCKFTLQNVYDVC